jgi:4-hydroxy-3-polyprenylbenzoate decarboxylase
VVPAFYSRPKTLDDIIDHTVGRLLDLFDLDVGVVKRWKAEPGEEADDPQDVNGETE